MQISLLHLISVTHLTRPTMIPKLKTNFSQTKLCAAFHCTVRKWSWSKCFGPETTKFKLSTSIGNEPVLHLVTLGCHSWISVVLAGLTLWWRCIASNVISSSPAPQKPNNAMLDCILSPQHSQAEWPSVLHCAGITTAHELSSRSLPSPQAESGCTVTSPSTHSKLHDFSTWMHSQSCTPTLTNFSNAKKSWVLAGLCVSDGGSEIGSWDSRSQVKFGTESDCCMSHGVCRLRLGIWDSKLPDTNNSNPQMISHKWGASRTGGWWVLGCDTFWLMMTTSKSASQSQSVARWSLFLDFQKWELSLDARLWVASSGCQKEQGSGPCILSLCCFALWPNCTKTWEQFSMYKDVTLNCSVPWMF